MMSLWLDLQAAFALFVAPLLAFFMGVAIAGAIAETIVGFLFQPVTRVEIVRRDDGDE